MLPFLSQIENPKVSLTSSPAFETWYPKELINFKCNVDVPSSWTYEWYQNGSKIHESTINNYKAAPLTHSSNGQYQCKVKRRGGQLYTSNDVSVKVAEPPTPIIKLETSWTDVFKTEKLRFSCTGPDSIWTLTWYKDQKKLETEGSALNIDSVTKDDKGVYTCKAEIKPRGVSSASSDTIVITVYENKPKPQLTRIPDFPTMYPGESVTFSCMVTESSGWEYEFYHRSTKIDPTSKSLERKVDVTNENSGEHQCLARRGQLKTEKSDPVSLHVSEIPVPVLKRKTQWWDVFPSERAELGCEMEGSSEWIFTWFKNGENVAGNSVTISEDGSILTITKASGSHHGNYSCSGELKDRTVRSIRSSEATLHVYDSKPTVTLLQNPDDKLLHTGDAISFTCHVNVSSGWKYSWYKDNNIISPTRITHNISSASTSETGSYECQVGRGEETPLFYSEKSRAVQLTVAERPKASIVLLTTWSEVFSTDSLKLQCEVVGSQDNWNYTWFKESEQLNQASLSTHSVTPSNDPDQSEYICQGIRTKRPLYSQRSDSYKTKNLLLKRRVLLSISGCIFFGIIAVFIGCIVMRVLRKPADADDKQDEANLFLTMAQLKDRNDAPCPLVEYITDADVNPPAKEGEENATSCTETTPLPITSPEEQAVTANGKETTENGTAMVSFLQ
uniref:Basement membrane-specific heparan sulfate proteoglycan core protein-like n=1 Tax=Cyprinodon variegatus TaxID=28743 RepID=A0A3Q2CWJ9_CYPVA